MMNFRSKATLFFLTLLLASCRSAAIPRADLAARVDAILAAHPQQKIAVAYHELDGSRELLRNEHERFHAASTMKVPVMLGIFEAVSRGELRLEQPVDVRNEFSSIVDGSKYALEQREDSDPELYSHIGQQLPLEELVRRMITRSSNLATNIIIEFIGAPRVMTLMKKIGANEIQVLRGVEDDKAYHAGLNNTTTAFDLMLIFRALGDHTIISANASDAMLDILAHQEHVDGIPAGVPHGTRVANKTGWIPLIAHDAALVMPEGSSPYVLVVLTRGFEKSEEADKVTAEISRAVWEARN